MREYRVHTLADTEDRGENRLRQLQLPLGKTKHSHSLAHLPDKSADSIFPSFLRQRKNARQNGRPETVVPARIFGLVKDSNSETWTKYTPTPISN
jgi:hypothetical protein